MKVFLNLDEAADLIEALTRVQPSIGDKGAQQADEPPIYDPILDTIDPAWADAGQGDSTND